MDFNAYRAKGHRGRFQPGTRDRAVSLVVVDSYERLYRALPFAIVQKGDLGENLLVNGPSCDEGVDIQVGTRLQIGDSVVIEISEANSPCYRLGYLPWADEVCRRYGDKWFKSNELPLSNSVHPGGRGWLARVLIEGEVKPGDTVQKA